MWKQKIGISICNGYPMTNRDFVGMLKKIGFDAISPGYNSTGVLEDTVISAKECGMEIESIHAPYIRSADMWSELDEKSALAKEEFMSALEACVRLSVPVLVVHPWIGFEYEFDDRNALCFKNYDDVVLRAEKEGITVAIENTEGDEYLDALMERYRGNTAVGYCWDSGHEMCYNHSEDLLAKYGDRLVITHLNDNLGISRYDGKTFWTDDLHLLPYDGIADWNYNTERLARARRLEYLNFELSISSKPNRHENDIYARMSQEEYYTEAYKRACRIAYRYSML